MLKKWIRRYLGLTQLDENMRALEMHWHQTKGTLGDIGHNIRVTNRAVARTMIKVDPLYAIPEDNPDRVAASNKLADEALARMKGEVLASNPTRSRDE